MARRRARKVSSWATFGGAPDRNSLTAARRARSRVLQRPAETRLTPFDDGPEERQNRDRADLLSPLRQHHDRSEAARPFEAISAMTWYHCRACQRLWSLPKPPPPRAAEKERA